MAATGDAARTSKLLLGRIASCSAGSLVGVTPAPAKPGYVIVMYGVGFGPVSPAIPEGQTIQEQNALASFNILIGGAPATVKYAGLAPNYVGLYQFNVVVPAIAASNAAPVTFTVDGMAGHADFVIGGELDGGLQRRDAKSGGIPRGRSA